MPSMWIRLPNGRDELVVNEDHIKRLLADGGVEILDPRISVEQVEIDESVVMKEEQPEHKQRKRKGVS